MVKLLFALSLVGAVDTEAEVVEPVEPVVEQVVDEEPVTEQVAVEETNAVDNFMNEYFSPDKIAMYMSWVTYAGTIVGLCASIKKLKKEKNLTVQDVSAAVQGKIKEAVADEIKVYLPSIVTTQENLKDTMKDFSKILALSQENTPESRIAILEVIEHLGTIGKEITDNSKQVVTEAVKAVETKKEETNKKIEEVIEKYKQTETEEKYDGTSI